MDELPQGLWHRAVFTCTIWAVVAWEKTTLGCSVLQCPSSSAWEGKSSPQSSQVNVVSVSLKCSLVTWLCRAPGKQKDAEQYKQRNGWEPGERSTALTLRCGSQGQPKGTGSCKWPGRTGLKPTRDLGHSTCQHPFSWLHHCFKQFVAVQIHFRSSSLQQQHSENRWVYLTVPAATSHLKHLFSLFPCTIQHCSLLAWLAPPDSATAHPLCTPGALSSQTEQCLGLLLPHSGWLLPPTSPDPSPLLLRHAQPWGLTFHSSLVCPFTLPSQPCFQACTLAKGPLTWSPQA